VVGELHFCMSKMPLMEGIQSGAHFATTRRKFLQPRGGKLCFYEDENFAASR